MLDHRRGNLILCTKRNYYKIIADQYFCLESYRYDSIEDAHFIEELAPSLLLKEIIEKGKQEGYDEKYIRTFKRRYINQLHHKSAARIIKRIQDYLKRGQTIIVFCEEEDERYNHVSILGEYFKEQGYRVDNRSEVKMHTSLKINTH